VCASFRQPTCAWIASYDVLWPGGYRVRVHPTELIGPRGEVVSQQSEDVSIGGQLVGTASWGQSLWVWEPWGDEQHIAQGTVRWNDDWGWGVQIDPDLLHSFQP